MAATLTDPAPSRIPHLRALDGLRGIAVLLVMWYHVWEMTWQRADVKIGSHVFNFNVFPETGSAGVDLFYFISGFCLFFPYARSLFDGDRAQTWAMFAYRRIIKIVPSYYLAIFLMIVLGLTHFSSTQDAIAQIASHLTFTQNVWFDTWGGIDGVMWSLATEVQFYVFFPLICWCALRRPLLTFGVLVAIGDLYRLVVWQHFDAVHELDRLPGAIDLFAAGMFTAYAYRFLATQTPRLAARRGLWFCVALVGLVASYALLHYEFARRFDPTWGTTWKSGFRFFFDFTLVPLTLGSLFAFTWWQRVLGNRVLLFLSLISYNLYLWHQPIARWIEDRKLLAYTTPDPKSDPTWQWMFTIVSTVASIGVAWAISAWFEQPILRRKPFLRAAAPRPLAAGTSPTVP
jgi:peptidoglycan/LPS O-acetylase OafA/YrhL